MELICAHLRKSAANLVVARYAAASVVRFCLLLLGLCQFANCLGHGLNLTVFGFLASSHGPVA